MMDQGAAMLASTSSPVADLLAADGAELLPADAGQAVIAIGDELKRNPGGLLLVDASALARRRLESSSGLASGSRGAAVRKAGGWLAAYPGKADMVLLPPLLSSGAAAGADELPAGMSDDPGFRHGYWFYVAGGKATELFAEGCELDLRRSRFGNHRVVQTLLYRTSATIVGDDAGDLPGYHILGCNSLAHHVYRKVRSLQATHGGGVLAFSGP
jgi:hypothetical protein